MVVEGCGWVCGGGFFFLFFFNMSCGELVVVVTVGDGWLWWWKALTRLVVLVRWLWDLQMRETIERGI